MTRLTWLLAIALFTSTWNTSAGQTANYTVAGDVERADTWEVSSEIPVTLRDLLEHAGAGQQGSAVILRDGVQPSGWSEFVSPLMSGRGSRLATGDIVIFHDPGRSTAGVANVVILADSVPRIVNLSASGNVLGNLLAAIGTEFSQNSVVPVVRTQFGRPVAMQLAPHDAILHGDVLMLGSAVPVNPVRVSQLFHSDHPAVNAERGSVRTVSASSIPTTASPKTGPPGTLLIPDTAQAESASAEPPPRSSVIDESRAATVPAMIFPAASQTAVTDELFADRAPETMPENDPLTDAGSQQAASTSPLWNGVFIFGLLGSIALIITGWLKTRADQQQLHRNDSMPLSHRPGGRPREHAENENHRKTGAVPQTATSPETPIAARQLSTIAAAKAAAAAVVPADAKPDVRASAHRELIGSEEWFGGDWIGDGVAAPANSSHEVANGVRPDDSVHSAVSGTAQSDIAAIDIPATDGLDDLIQNRLPTHLEQIDLPLRVTLFGRPAGPQRLRVDAAHTEIAAPHFASTGPSKRRHRDSHVSAAVPDSATGNTGSLDRALNSLHGQNHS